MKEEDLCFILEPRPTIANGASIRDRMSATEIVQALSRKNEGDDANPVNEDMRDFGGSPYGSDYRPVDVGRHTNTLNMVYDEIILPAIDGRNFRIVRSSQMGRPEHVTRAHVNRVLNAGLVIADLSLNDPVVAYCLALRMQFALTNDIDPGLIALQDEQTVEMFDIPGPFDYPVRYQLVGDAEAPADKQAAIKQTKLLKARADLTHEVMRFIDRREGKAERSKQTRHTDNASANDTTTTQRSEHPNANSEAKIDPEDLVKLVRDVLTHDQKSDSLDRLKRRLFRDL